MRTTWKRTAAGLLVAGALGGAAWGLARPGEPPSRIEPADLPQLPAIQAGFVESPQSVLPMPAVEKAPTTDPAVSLEWAGPPVVKVNSPCVYTLTVKNVCAQSLQKVVVQVRPPKDVAVSKTEPAAKPNDGVYLWEFGSLDAKASKSIQVTLVPSGKGELNCQAWVTLTGTSAMKATVKEPKINVSIRAPEKVMVGDKIPVEYVVTNTGDFAASEVVLKLVNSATPTMAPRELKPGEAQKMTDEFVSNTGGTFTYEAVATGADGLKSSAKATVQVLAPKIDLAIAGPAERLIGKKATYTLTVRNCGDVPVSGVIVRDAVPASFRVSLPTGSDLSATGGDRLSWAVGDLAVGAVKKLEFEGICTAAGTILHSAEAVGDRGAKAAAECTTKVEGIAALRMEMVDSVDPVEKGGETVYEIKVTNTGTKADTNVKIECELPKEFEFVSASGPTKGGLSLGIKISDPKREAHRFVLFEPISELSPKMEATFKVKVKSVGTGDLRFKAVMTSQHLTTPVVKEESTRVYGE